jgi:dTDP-4-dehydrorhamnose reductase
MPRLRIAVTGTKGQLVRCLLESASQTDTEIIALGRPELELSKPETINTAIVAGCADVLVSTAAYTDVNKAEAEPLLADLINGRAPGLLAAHARKLGIPFIHMSTDYVFDGAKSGPYREDDAVCPLNAYGRSKAKGERAVADAHPYHVILRTSWIYSPFGRNFVRTMLDRARQQPAINVVSDQIGNPTAASDIASGIFKVARNLVVGEGDDRYGIFHMAGSGAASWTEFAEGIFATSAALGGPTARVIPISSADLQTSVRRPENSRLDCAKIAGVHGVELPAWQASIGPCIKQILEQDA